MRKLFGFLVVAVLGACTCLSQIPDQFVYIDQNCEAVMPNYIPDVIVVDNCDNAIVTQQPIAESILSSGEPVMQVVIRAKDQADNESSIHFNIIFLDTISPVLSVGPGLLAYNEAVIGRVIRRMHYGVIAMHDSILVKYPQANQDTSYRQENLMIISSLNTNAMPMSFVDPNYIVLAGDSATLADRCDIHTRSIRLHFATVEN